MKFHEITVISKAVTVKLDNTSDFHKKKHFVVNWKKWCLLIIEMPWILHPYIFGNQYELQEIFLSTDLYCALRKSITSVLSRPYLRDTHLFMA